MQEVLLVLGTHEGQSDPEVPEQTANSQQKHEYQEQRDVDVGS